MLEPRPTDVGDESGGSFSDRWQARGRVTLAAGAAVLIVERLILVSRGIPTGYDESLYVLRALRWSGHAPPYDVGAHMPGVSALVAPLAALDPNVGWYRVLMSALGVILCAATYLVGRRFLGRLGAGAAALILGLLPVQLYASLRVLPDIPASGGVTLAFLFYWKRVAHLSSDRSPLLWPIGVILGCVFYLNPAYAALAGLTLGIDYLIQRRRRPSLPSLILAAIAFGAVLGPYFFRVWRDHGHPFHLIAFGYRNSGRSVGAPAGADPGNYASWFFDPRYWLGPLVGLLVLAGGYLLVQSLRGRGPAGRRDARLLALWAAVPTTAMGVLVHPENRYLLLSLPAFALIAGLAAEALVLRLRAWRPLPGVASSLLVAFGVSSFVLTWLQVDRTIRNEGAIHRVGSVVAARADHPCQVFSAYPTQMTFATRCRGFAYGTGGARDLLRRAERFSGATYFVWFEGAPNQPAWLPRFPAGEVTSMLTIPTGTFLGRAEAFQATTR